MLDLCLCSVCCCLLFVSWFVWVFQSVFPYMGFLSLVFPLVDVGQHPPKFFVYFLPPALVCVAFE